MYFLEANSMTCEYPRNTHSRINRFILSIPLLLLFLYGALQAQPSSATDVIQTVVLSEPADPFVDLAREISQTENLPLVPTLEEALDYHPVFLLWVVSPDRLSDREFSRVGKTLMDRRAECSIGLLTGSTIEKARALWQRKINNNGSRLAVIPRENTIHEFREGTAQSIPLTKQNLVESFQKSSCVTYAGHASASHWKISENEILTAEDIPELPPVLINALACQTLKIWRKDSIALRFVDQGAAAYLGYVHSPLGHALGEPMGFPLLHTWPEFPIGHVMQVQNHGMLQGFLQWPFYFILGDPRQSFQTDRPYEVTDDTVEQNRRIIKYRNTPAGVLPVMIPDAAEYSYVEILDVGSAGMNDPFFNPYVQMTNIGQDKYLLFEQPGGDFSVILRRNPPILWQVYNPIITALDQSMFIYHAEGSVIFNYVLVVLFILLPSIYLWRQRINLRSLEPAAIGAGLSLTIFRGLYACFRHEHISTMLAGRLRTMDVAFEINVSFLIITFLLACCGMLLYKTVKSRWMKALALLIATAPSWILAIFWLGMCLFINIMAQREYGIGLYGYGQGIMALITFGVEMIILALILLVIGYRQKTLGCRRK